jgi:hypothetical protein
MCMRAFIEVSVQLMTLLLFLESSFSILLTHSLFVFLHFYY